MTDIPPIRRLSPDIRDLEQVEPGPSVQYRKLDPRIRYLWLVGRGIFWTVFFLITLSILGAIHFLGPGLPQFVALIVGGVLCLALLHMIWPFFSYHHWGFAVRRTDVLVRRGVLFRRVAAVPFARIQHVDSHSGPFERGLGLANVVIHTAGSQLGALNVPGLEEDEAEELRDYLSKVGHAHANL